MTFARRCLSALLALSLTTPLSTPALAQREADPLAAVDPFIGTGGEGHTFPGAVAPFGMVQLSPDTDTTCVIRDCYSHAAGYRYEDPTMQGFSHTHFSGAGHSDLGDFLLMPAIGTVDAVKLEPGDAKQPGSGYRSRFSHRNEQATPGYYSVQLDDAHVRAELTAGARVGVHRYTFRSGDEAHLILDLRSSLYNYPGKTLWSSIRLRPDGTITGSRQTRGWAPDRKLFFAMRFSRPLTNHAFVSTETDVTYKGFQGPGRGSDRLAERSGRALVGRLDFGKLDKPLEVTVAISSVDEDGAVANLKAESGGFDAVRNATTGAWKQALGVLDVDGDAAMRKNVMTALYHSLIAPSVTSDVDGRWRGPDNQVHRAEGYTQRSTFSLWDTFRAEHPLLTLVQPAEVNSEIIRSLIASQQVSPDGILPVWQFQGRETWTMIGYHAVPVIADAYLKGIRGFDATQALAAMIKSATYAPYGGLADLPVLHYIPIDHEPEAASKTVEYAYDDWTIAQMARAMGRDDVATWFDARSGYWRNTFDPKTGFVRARKADGSFREPFDPTAINYGSDYTEGNAWQYSWFVPQDQAALFDAMGGDQAAVTKLDQMFDYDNSKLDYSHAEDIAGLIGQYIHGNEPSHHVAYLYDHAGQPWRTQYRLTQIVNSQFKPTPDGLAGNDDLGQMSAWLVFTALGFYPVTPGSLEYAIGRPFVRRAALDLPNGKRFTIVADNFGQSRPYIGAVMLNGRPLERSYLTHAEIMAGGELRFAMSAEPNYKWATDKHARPFSASVKR
ncbi:alpha-1,2-mannosidase, putative [Sphingomonas palmae]|uniref:Alpha-1,2-mannosidase, putative n=1 Tax=Sphingomonas palmae TaxID=1855283 RepID=A0A1H7R6Y2_9SPHN|nr:GH92 family glycosyl hydrolase [Sphingomonas palmae]SEL55953.1 alpha-1,2-mannosidase, putative [Sphingomonas palmae]